MGLRARWRRRRGAGAGGDGAGSGRGGGGDGDGCGGGYGAAAVWREVLGDAALLALAAASAAFVAANAALCRPTPSLGGGWRAKIWTATSSLCELAALRAGAVGGRPGATGGG